MRLWCCRRPAVHVVVTKRGVVGIDREACERNLVGLPQCQVVQNDDATRDMGVNER